MNTEFRDIVLKFRVCGRAEIEEFTANAGEKYALISIKDTQDDRGNLIQCARVLPDPNRVAVLYLAFDDTDRPEDHTRCSIAQAKQIVEFVEQYKDQVDYFICQCEAGISRSAGVAAALSYFYCKNDTYYFYKHHPNRWAYRLVLNELFKDTE